jgi:hypothetical protein
MEPHILKEFSAQPFIERNHPCPKPPDQLDKEEGYAAELPISLVRLIKENSNLK